MMEEQIVGEDQINCQIGGFSRLVAVDRILESPSAAVSNLSAVVPDCKVWFPVLCQEDFKHSFLVSRAFKL